MKRALVTGATGFVGANLARRLLRDGCEVHLLLRPAHNPWRIDAIRSDVHLHILDFNDGEALMREVESIRPDWIFHLAAYGAYSQQNDLGQMIQTNIAATTHLVEACLKTGFAAFVNTGSSSEYGFKDKAPSEAEFLQPNSHYAWTKAAATHFCSYTARDAGVHLPTLRLYSVYGPFEEPTRLLPTLVLKGLQGEFPPLVHPDIARDFVYVDDVSEAYIQAASVADQEPGAVYNIATGLQTSLSQVVELAKQVLDIRDEPQWGSMPNRHWDSTTWVGDNDKMRRVLGWCPRHTFEQGFRQTVDWFRHNSSILPQKA